MIPVFCWNRNHRYPILESIPVEWKSIFAGIGIGIKNFLKMMKIRFRLRFRSRSHNTSNFNPSWERFCLGRGRGAALVQYQVERLAGRGERVLLLPVDKKWSQWKSHCLMIPDESWFVQRSGYWQQFCHFPNFLGLLRLKMFKLLMMHRVIKAGLGKIHLKCI